VDFDTRAPQSSQVPTNYVPVQPQLSVYHHPANSWVMIEILLADFDHLENVIVVITDVTGKQIHQTNLVRTTYLWETELVFK